MVGNYFRRWRAGLGVAGAFCLWPGLAFAEEVAPSDASTGILVALAGVATAYLLSFLLLGWLTRQYGFVTGVQYVVLGMLVVPLTGWIPLEALQTFEPIVGLATGAVGLTVGLRVSRRRLAELTGTTVKLAMSVVSVTLGLVVLLPLLGLYHWGDPGTSDYWIPAILALGAMALVADWRQVAALANFFNVEETTITKARNLAWLSTTAAVVCFGVLFSYFNPGPQWFGDFSNMGIWLAAHVVAGGVVGAIGGSLVQTRPDDDRILTILLGVVITASALAYVTTLSIVFVNFVAGIILINMSSESLRIRGMLDSANAPLYILLLFIVGTIWSAGTSATALIIIGAYLALRLIGRIAGVAAYRPRLSGYRPEPGIHRVLWAPGALTAAMIVDFSFGFSDLESMDTVISAFVLILIAEEVVSFILARGWMIDVSDADPSRRRSSPWGDWKGGN